jgi:hypothetical protein
MEDSVWGYSSVGRALPLQGRCQRFESAYLHPNLIAFSLIRNQKSDYQSEKLSQMNKGLWWIPRHLETMKGVVTDETLRGAGNKL